MFHEPLRIVILGATAQTPVDTPLTSKPSVYDVLIVPQRPGKALPVLSSKRLRSLHKALREPWHALKHLWASGSEVPDTAPIPDYVLASRVHQQVVRSSDSNHAADSAASSGAHLSRTWLASWEIDLNGTAA